MQRIEMEAVKRERSHLMASLAEIKTQSGKAGGELQQEDVRRLRKEVEIKMQKLNEIRKVSCATDHRLDCEVISCMTCCSINKNMLTGKSLPTG